jgi:small multidrug resistance family-3 protein
MDVVPRSLALFVLARLCEIGGGYLVWQWWRSGRAWPVGAIGAAYGGVFIVLALMWGWAADRIVPDRFDLLGAALCFAGVGVIMYWPR